MAVKKSGTTDSVGKRIKKIRTDKKMSLEQMANETGHAVEYLKDIEAGKIDCVVVYKVDRLSRSEPANVSSKSVVGKDSIHPSCHSQATSNLVNSLRRGNTNRPRLTTLARSSDSNVSPTCWPSIPT